MRFNPKDSRDSLAQANNKRHKFDGKIKDDYLSTCKKCGLNGFALVHTKEKSKR